MKTIILANGEGERLKPITEKLSKVMIPIANKPLLQHIIEHLASYGFNKIVLAVGVKKEQIIDYFKDGSAFNVRIEYSISDKPLGTAGEVANAIAFLKDEDDFMVYYGDTLTNLNLKDFYNFHKSSNSAITGPGMKEVYTESGIYVCSSDGSVKSFHEKPFINDLTPLPNIFSNVPIYLASKQVLQNQNIAIGKDFADVVSDFIKTNQVSVFYQQGLWHLDIGNLKKYKAACRAYEQCTQSLLRKLA